MERLSVCSPSRISASVWSLDILKYVLHTYFNKCRRTSFVPRPDFFFTAVKVAIIRLANFSYFVPYSFLILASRYYLPLLQFNCHNLLLELCVPICPQHFYLTQPNNSSLSVSVHLHRTIPLTPPPLPQSYHASVSSSDHLSFLLTGFQLN